MKIRRLALTTKEQPHQSTLMAPLPVHRNPGFCKPPQLAACPCPCKPLLVIQLSCLGPRQSSWLGTHQVMLMLKLDPAATLIVDPPLQLDLELDPCCQVPAESSSWLSQHAVGREPPGGTVGAGKGWDGIGSGREALRRPGACGSLGRRTARRLPRGRRRHPRSFRSSGPHPRSLAPLHAGVTGKETSNFLTVYFSKMIVVCKLDSSTLCL